MFPLMSHSGQSQIAIFCYPVTSCGIHRYSMELIGGLVVEDRLGSAAKGAAAATGADPPCSRHRQLHQTRHQHVDDCCRSPCLCGPSTRPPPLDNCVVAWTVLSPARYLSE